MLVKKNRGGEDNQSRLRKDRELNSVVDTRNSKPFLSQGEGKVGGLEDRVEKIEMAKDQRMSPKSKLHSLSNRSQFFK